MYVSFTATACRDDAEATTVVVVVGDSTASSFAISSVNVGRSAAFALQHSSIMAYIWSEHRFGCSSRYPPCTLLMTAAFAIPAYGLPPSVHISINVTANDHTSVASEKRIVCIASGDV